MRFFKFYPVYVIYQALSTRLEYGNVTYQVLDDTVSYP